MSRKETYLERAKKLREIANDLPRKEREQLYRFAREYEQMAIKLEKKPPE